MLTSGDSQLMVPLHPMYSDTYDSASPLVKAALKVATAAHANDTRTRKIGTFPYITHPIMVCKLLEKLGKGDDINIAVGLLHDVLEDNPKYKENPTAMCEDLKAALVELDIDDEAAEEMAYKVFGYCKELCNPNSMVEGKRIYQVDHVSHLSKRAKLIKVLDQTASVLEDIWFESNRSPEQLEKFAFKGLNIAKSAESGGEEAHLMAYQFNKIVFRYFANLAMAEQRMRDEQDPIRAADMQAATHKMREEFDVGRAMEQARDEMELETAETLNARLLRGDKPGYIEDENDIKRVHHPIFRENQFARLKFGCVYVDVINDKGAAKVCAYTTAISARGDEDSPANLASMNLMTGIESFATRQRVTIHDSEVKGTGLVRRFTIKPAMELDEFMRKAAQASQRTNDELADEATNTGSPPLVIIDQRMKSALDKARREIEGNSQSVV